MNGVMHNSGFKVGSVIARDGRPGSTESQVEQTLDKSWALRPELTRTVEVEKDRIGEAEWDPQVGFRETMLAAGTKDAGQLGKLI
jgi:hypothetical protein